MDDWLFGTWQMGKPTWYVTNHLDQLSLAIPLEVPAKADM